MNLCECLKLTVDAVTALSLLLPSSDSLFYCRVEVTGELLATLMKKIIKKLFATSSVVLSNKIFFSPLEDGLSSSNLFHLRKLRKHKLMLLVSMKAKRKALQTHKT